MYTVYCMLYSVQCTVHSSQCTVHSAQCTVHERVAPQQEGKEDYWAAEDQPREHLQELLSLSTETPCCTVTLWIYMLSRHLQHNVLQVLEWSTCAWGTGTGTVHRSTDAQMYRDSVPAGNLQVQCSVPVCKVSAQWTVYSVMYTPATGAQPVGLLYSVQCALYSMNYTLMCTV